MAAAALTYFNKSLDELSVAEAAYLAALPKAPNNYHPIRHHAAALARRNYVINRMLEDGYISEAEAAEARATPLVVSLRTAPLQRAGNYFVEEVRRKLVDRYGEDALLRGGLVVRATLDPRLQAIADRVLRKGLIAYDRRHGWRGPIARLEPGTDWALQLGEIERPPGLGTWQLAVVLKVDDGGALIGLADGVRGRIPLDELTWARARRKNQTLGPKVTAAWQVLAPGDVVAVEAVTSAETEADLPTFALRQIPDVEGALVALDPHTGRVLAMSGGYSFEMSQFNRATQATRQPGSAFKPFVYLAALDYGYTPATIVLDAPVVIKSEELGTWKPENYSKKFYGPLPLRVGLEKSRNLMTLRLPQTIGTDRIARYGERFGIADHLPRELGMALGASETTLLRLTTAYAMLVNGGKRISPSLIDRVQDRYGRTIFRHDERVCPECAGVVWANQEVPDIPDNREQIANPMTVYQVVSMLQGVVQRGTGWRVRAVGKPIAGKTGTTNEYFDAWFLGFTPDLVAGVWVGFDQPQTLGRSETGSRAASPIFTQFMKEALAGKPPVPFRIPEGIKLVRINALTGRPARSGDKKVIVEAFRAAQADAPGGRPATVTGRPSGSDAGGVAGTGTGGLY